MTLTFEDRKRHTGYSSLYQARISENRILTPEGGKPFRHLSFSRTGIGQLVEPGDYIGLFVSNAAGDVEAVLAAGGFSPETPVTITQEKPGWDGPIVWQHTLPLAEALTRRVHIATASDALLTALGLDENPEDISVAGALQATRTSISAQQLCDLCHGLDQRRFSLSDIQPDHISIVESPISYEKNGTLHTGVFTRQAETLAPGDEMDFYIDPSPFGLPWKPREHQPPMTEEAKREHLTKPMIFIGPGTGIAPYLPMMESLQREGYQNSCWLITGNRTEKDLLYRDRLDALHAAGVLDRLTYAASREEGKPRTYVQDIVRQESAALWDQLQSGAFLYLYGDHAMVQEVEQALKDVAMSHGGMDAPQAAAWLDTLRQQQRFFCHSYRQSLQFEPETERKRPPVTTDMLVLGSGPAGCSAALYAARSGAHTLVLEGDRPGGQLIQTHLIENYPGLDVPIAASSLMEQMRAQAVAQGATFATDTIRYADLSQHPFRLTGDSGTEYLTDQLVIATGATAKWLGIPGESELLGRGVSNCATCDGPFFKGKPVAVIGGGDSAVEEALHLKKIGAEVTLIHRGDTLRASHILQERLTASGIPILWNSEATAIHGKSSVDALTLRHTGTGTASTLPVNGVFIAIGHTPNSSLFQGQLAMDSRGYIQTEGKTTRTSIPGIYAAGEVADPSYRQAITSAGEGAKAALDATSHALIRTTRHESTLMTPSIAA